MADNAYDVWNKWLHRHKNARQYVKCFILSFKQQLFCSNIKVSPWKRYPKSWDQIALEQYQMSFPSVENCASSQEESNTLCFI